MTYPPSWGKQLDYAFGFMRRANSQLDVARDQLERYQYSECISSSIESMELMLKAMFMLLTGDYPTTHEFPDDKVQELLEKVPKEMEYLNFPRIFTMFRFWVTKTKDGTSFYAIAKYGHKSFGIAADRLFKNDEASLALKHAEECAHAVSILENFIIKKRQVWKKPQKGLD
mgnify:CR=1 FL=1